MNETSTTYSISDLAKEFGVTTRTIRHYEDIGLLSPEREGQLRIYSRGDRTRLKLILRGKRLGFSLEESRDIIQMYRPDQNNKQQLNQLLDKIELQKQCLNQRLTDLHAMMTELDEVEKVCQKALKQI